MRMIARIEASEHRQFTVLMRLDGRRRAVSAVIGSPIPIKAPHPMK
jgi:hypothetical protein